MKLLPFLLSGIVLFSCSKDNLETKPQIQIESYSTQDVPRLGSVLINLAFSDKEGDLAGGQFTYIPNRMNRRRLPADLSYNPITVLIPQFADKSKGRLELQLLWRDLYRSDRGNDTVNFKFMVTDRAGNSSDTVQSEAVVFYPG